MAATSLSMRRGGCRGGAGDADGRPRRPRPGPRTLRRPRPRSAAGTWSRCAGPRSGSPARRTGRSGRPAASARSAPRPGPRRRCPPRSASRPARPSPPRVRLRGSCPRCWPPWQHLPPTDDATLAAARRVRVRRRPRCPGRRAPRVRREADSEKSSGGPRRPSGPGAEPLRPRDRGLGVTCRPPAGARTHTGGARRPPPARCSTRGRLGGGPTSGAQRAAPRCGHGTARADSLTSAPGTRLESCPCLRPR